MVQIPTQLVHQQLPRMSSLLVCIKTAIREHLITSCKVLPAGPLMMDESNPMFLHQVAMFGLAGLKKQQIREVHLEVAPGILNTLVRRWLHQMPLEQQQ